MIPDDILEEIAAHAERESPREACGFISKKGDAWKIHPVSNASEHPESEFIMEPQAQIDAMRNIRNCGAELSGTYHSHPKTQPVPSLKDMQLSLYPDLLHTIVSLLGGEPEFSVWCITETGFREVPGLRQNPHMS